MSTESDGNIHEANPVALVHVNPLHKGMAIACCGAAIATLAPVALVQLKLLKRLPDPPGRFFDSEKIVTSEAASHFGIPDGVLGLGSYGMTLALLIAAKPSRPLVRKMLGAKLALDATVATRSVRKQITKHGRICSWCLGAAIATAGMVYFARKVQESARQHSA